MNSKIAVLLFLIVLYINGGEAQSRRRGRPRDIRGRVIGNITGDTYRPDLSSVIPGSSSLAFVFDVTGSMWDDLKQVTAGARQILDRTRTRAEKPLHNYILIPFHDPVVGPAIVTSNPRIFTRALKDLYVQGGGDCPEMSVTAIREALLLSLPGSFIYVFTDARSKDFFQLPEILQIIQRKQSQVVFVLTGDCEDQKHKGYKAYEKIAATSSGQVFLITKDDVSEVVKFIEVSVQAQKVVLLATDHRRGGHRTWSVPFDPKLQEITISVSGSGRGLALVDPDGITVTEENGLETLLNLENVLIVNIKEPKPGTWKITADSSSEHSLRVTGLSTLDFQARFSRKPTFNWTETEFQPVAGIPSYILINATGLERPGRFRTLRLLDLTGRPIRTISLSTPRDPDQPYLYTVDPFIMPRRPFHIAIYGNTFDDYRFVRATKNAILNIVPVAPNVEVPETHPGYFDYATEIPCHITSLIPYHVQWSREIEGVWVELDQPRFYRDTTIDYYRIEEITEGAEGIYRCYANNSKGSDSGDVFLDVEERPPIVTTNGNVTVIPGEEVALTCQIISNVAYTITWSRVDGTIIDTDRTRKLRNGSLLIQRAEAGDEGDYRCTAVNIGGESSDVITLIVQRPPQVTITPSETSSFSLGGTIRIECAAIGLPQPTIEWLKESTYLLDIGKIRIGRGGSYLEVVNSNEEDEGIYTCQASNRAGTDSASVQWIFTEEPVVAIPESDLLVLEGTSVTIQCEVNGIPTPTVTWSTNEENIVTGRKYEVTDDGFLHIHHVSRSDSGVFVCTGRNSAGLDSDRVNLQVGWAPSIITPPTDQRVNYGSNVTFQCVADGFPTPEISWYRGSTRGRGDYDSSLEKGTVHHLPPSSNLSIFDLSLHDNGLYTCSAKNIFGLVTSTTQLTVTGTSPPRVDVGNLVPHVIVGQSIVIPCRIVSGNPLPTRQWRRRLMRFTSSERKSLNAAGSIVINQAEPADAGPYECIATNVIGEDARRVDLDVWVPTQIVSDKSRYHTIEHSPIPIPCSTRGNPRAEIEWRMEGMQEPLNNQIGYEVTEDGTLNILDPTSDNTGSYICTASNPAGRDQIDVDLDVYFRPRLGENTPDHYSVIVNNPITLECNVESSDPPPTYTWVKDGERLTGNEAGLVITSEGDLMIGAAKETDAGRYTCVATNVAGSIQHDMELDVLIPPTIRRGPSLIKVLVSETATLTCHAFGFPVPQIIWKRERHVIDQDFHPRFNVITSQDSSRLIIEDAMLEDDDEYVCVAVNRAGRDRSTVTLDVQKTPTIFGNKNCLPSMSNCTATPVESGSLRLTCNATGDPQPIIRWYHGEEELQNEDPNVRIDSDGTLTLFVVSSSDNGQYICEAENERGIVTEVTNVVVLERPEIDGSSSDVEKIWVLEGENVDLSCDADAVPPPVITWYEESEEQQSLVYEEENHISFLRGNRIFRITKAKVSDTGLYKCTAVNQVGKTNKYVRLDVYVRPSIRDNNGVSVNTVNLYDSIDLHCDVEGIPFPTIEWYKGIDDLVPDDERVQLIDRGQTLRINSALVTDTSSYKCIATNKVGDVSKFFDLNVHIPPSIKGTDQIYTMTVNDRLTLQCIASGIPNPSVEWTRSGVVVTSRPGMRISRDNQVIDIPRVQVSDEGTYVCKASNEAGESSKTHTVIVLVPPTISGDDTSNVTVTLGGSVTLTCDASGDPPPTIVWLKDGTPIFSADENIDLSVDNRQITITRARESDKGEYTCIASNTVGDQSQTHYLDVLVPPMIGNPNQEVIAIEKDTTTLHCMVYGHPFPEIRWEAYGVPVVPDERITFSKKGQELTISDVTETDAKEYTCTATNPVGRSNKRINFIVHVPPTVTYPVKNRIEHSVIEGNRYQLRCVANGIPIPTITWLKDGLRLTNDKLIKFKNNGGIMSIKKASVALHEGVYECVATNGVGEDSREMSLVVHVLPVISGHGKTMNNVVEVGRSEILECKIKKGKPTPEIRWYNRDNQLINSTSGLVFTNNKQRLHILSAQLSDVGHYWCEATNVAGRSRKDFNLDVIVPPVIRGEGQTTKVSVVLDNDATLECHVTGIPTPDITWKKDGRPISLLRSNKFQVSAGGSRLTVLNAVESNAGLYQCVATNAAGNSSKGFQLDVYLPPSIEGNSIENITVVENNPATLVCDVDAFPPPQIKWFKNSRPLLLGPGIQLSLNDAQLDILWVQEQDAALYHCEATNVAGKQKKYFRLKVDVLPTIFGPPFTRLEHVVGDQIWMMCDFDGVPHPIASWTKDGESLAGDDSIRSGGRVFVIEEAEVEDSGTFTCNASNEAGSDTKVYEVVVYDPPFIQNSDEVETVVVNRGDSLTLECDVKGTPTPEIVWRKNRQKLSQYFSNAQPSPDGKFLTIEESGVEDAGKYTCTATNLVGVAQKRFQVEVRVPPSVRDEGEVEYRWVVRENNISLTCDADAIPPPTLEWRVNGEPLEPTQRVRPQSGGRILFISFAKNSDAAMYSCIATNAAGSSSRDIQLDVYSTPSIPGSDVVDTHNINRGLPFSLECNVEGFPIPDIEWQKDGQTIASTILGVVSRSSAGFAMSQDGRYLTVDSADLKHTGDYTCRAVNQAGEDSKQHQVNVRVPPSISDEDSSPPVVITHVNTPTLLRCSVYGVPSPTIEWLKNGKIIDFDEEEHMLVQFGGRYLRISSTALEDEGVYSCIASNPAGKDSKDFQLVVNVPPVIEGSDVVTPTSVGLPTNHTIILRCIITEGNPFPTITWTKGRVRLEESSLVHFSSRGQTLEIIGSKISDTGRYRCMAINDAGEDSKSFDVEVQTPPSFSDGDKVSIVDVNENSPLHLHCKIIAVPMPELTWLKNGKPITSNEDVYIFPGGRTLQIVSAKASDAGNYTCVAANKIGSDEKHTEVSVNIPPTIGDGNNNVPEVVEETVGNSFTLECFVTGTPQPEVSWFKNGILLESDAIKYDIREHGQTLTVLDAVPSDSAHYNCRAENKAGQDNKVFHSRIHVAPVISGPEFQQKIATQNSVVVLVCDASGEPEPSLSWTKDGKPLRRKEQGYSVVSQGRLLIILSAQPDDNGNFTCEASNIAGQDRKTYEILTYVAPTLPKTSGDITVNQGETAVLNCQTNAIPQPEVRWTKNGQTIDLKALVKGTKNTIKISKDHQTLTIYDAKESDIGRYMCVVSNDAGIDSKNFKLSVNVPPSIIGPTSLHVTSVEGSPLTLFCDAHAVPTATLTWVKDGVSIRNSDSLTIVSGGSRLQIGSSHVRDAGRYVCFAQNIAGNADKEINVSVHVPPSIEASESDINLIQGQSETLECVVTGIPQPEVMWYKNGEKITLSSHPNLAVSYHGTHLSISRPQLSDSGEYVCEAVNAAGSDKATIDVHVLVPPSLENTNDSSNHIEVNAGNPVVMECDVTGGIPLPSISWLRNGISLEMSDRIQLMSGGRVLKILQSQESDTATYRCVAMNEAGSVNRDFKLDVYVPPMFLSDDDEDITVFSGDSVTLDCSVLGTPVPHVAWSKDEQALRGLSNREDAKLRSILDSQVVVISKAELSDTGRYTCLAVSIAGEKDKNFNLVVYEPTAIDGSEETEQIVVNVGDSINLICDASAVPPPVVSWIKNLDEPLIDSSRILNNGQRMYVQSAELSDAGTYTCVATSPAGVVEKDYDVIVNLPPTINDHKNNVTAVVGDNVTLECKSDAYPPPTLTWYKNGQKLNHEERFLRLFNVQVFDAGEYICTASNVAGTTSQDTHLSVYTPPTINDGPSSITATIGDTVLLPCVPQGIPAPRIKWRKGSVQINDDVSDRYIFQEKGSLLIEEIEVGDAGRFVCLVSNSAGSERRIIDVTVHVPPSIKQGSTNVSVTVNNPVTLDCEVKGIPQPQVIWLKNESVLNTKSDPAFSVLRSGSLRIASAAVADSGNYRCVVTNDAGREFRDISLFVQVPPSISNGPSNFRRNPGTYLRIPCDVSGIPNPQVTWTHNGQLIENTNHVYIDGEKGLVFSSISLDHDGVYVCTAVNHAGSARYETVVDVYSLPSIFPSPQEVEIFEGYSVTLQCDVTGTPEPVVTWRKGPLVVEDSTRITIGSDHNLVIDRSEMNDAGTYTCVAQNAAGVASKDVRLIVYSAPEFETEIPASRIAVAGEPLSIPVVVSGYHEPSVTWTRNGVELESEDGSLQIPVVSLTDQGLYAVTASNLVRSITRYMRLIVHSSPEVIALRDTDVIVNRGEQIALNVVVKGKPQPDVTWTKDGKELTRDNFRFRFSNSGTLTILNSKSTDTGDYIATAINEAGRGSIAFNVKVQVPPEITESPRNIELNVGQPLDFTCAASGIPTPTITWFFKNQPAPRRAMDASGRSRFHIAHVRPQDAGLYKCEARNPAGSRMKVAFVTVKSPPKFGDEFDRIQTRDLGEDSLLNCPAEADPAPSITWTKEGQQIFDSNRIRQFGNGSLLIYNTELDDAGDYICTAVNEAGSAKRTITLNLQRAPKIVVSPKSKVIDAGDTIMLDCVAHGEPRPIIEWEKDSRPMTFDERTFILSNNSLQIVTSRLADTSAYQCVATNFKGSDQADALITIRVHGGFSEWGEFGACSSTCGEGVQQRQRSCTNPSPANGGNACEGEAIDERSCQQKICPVDGGWGLWSFWEECSVTCGQGTRSRSRKCNKPTPQFGGLPCNGPDTEQVVCAGLSCAVDGAWSRWGVWLPCSASCGKATQIRVRQCNNPPPSGGGALCFGSDTSLRVCNSNPCPVNGNWSPWDAWDVCSVSCGGGIRSRGRSCSDPPPTIGGRPCSGSNRQTENCNPEPCSVNGNWASWSPWSVCSRSCGGGQLNRYRSCTNPPPKHGGRFCYGADSELSSCGLQPCPVDGNWSPWTEWSSCSKTCGFGERSRSRLCNNPQPSASGKQCEGDATQVDRCRDRFCSGGPNVGEGVVFGTINDIPFGGSHISANATDIGDGGSRIIAKITDIPPRVGPYLKSQISILTPIYWTMAKEIEGAYNGYTLTKGVFDRTVVVEFASGDSVKMIHKAKGLDSDGKLQMEVALQGTVPETDIDTEINILDYTEDYIQTGPGSIYAVSDRLFSWDGYILPYTWNHTIVYNASNGKMPFLVEQLSAKDIVVEYDEDLEELSFQIDVKIGRGNPSDRCPKGFFLDDSGMFCLDENECATTRPCSHSCINVMGSYVCGCPEGFFIGSNGKQCEDINECETGEYICSPTFECVNTLGSYRCAITCGPGLRRTEDGNTCEDINECEEAGEQVCNHVCLNTMGSYRCECRHGYRRSSRGRCIDINECRRGACKINQRCVNTEGGYRCIDDCPTGMEKSRFGVCIDINECTTGRHECGPGMLCRNTEGGYNCACPPGYKATRSTPPCVDIDECHDYPRSPCPHECLNTIGSFECVCPPGLRYLADRKSCVGLIRLPHNNHAIRLRPSRPTSSYRYRHRNRGRFVRHVQQVTTLCELGFIVKNGKCTDINECLEVAGTCQHSCENTVGSYRCVCPEGYRVAKNGRNCEDIDECAEGLMHCLPNQKCFNKRGSVTCINTPCPRSYIRVSENGYCLKQCFGPDCANKPRYAIEYQTVALPFGIGANQDLVRLAVYNSDNRLHRNTKFQARNTFGNPFGIRNENDKGVVYTTKSLTRSRTYHLEAMATSYAESGRVEYQTKFIIYISVAAHRF